MAKGFDAQNDRVYVVKELDSMEVIQNAMAKNQENYGSWCGYVHNANDPFARLI